MRFSIYYHYFRRFPVDTHKLYTIYIQLKYVYMQLEIQYHRIISLHVQQKLIQRILLTFHYNSQRILVVCKSQCTQFICIISQEETNSILCGYVNIKRLYKVHILQSGFLANINSKIYLKMIKYLTKQLLVIT